MYRCRDVWGGGFVREKYIHGCSPYSQWLRLRLVSACPLREVFDLGVSTCLVFSLAFLLSSHFAETHIHGIVATHNLTPYSFMPIQFTNQIRSSAVQLYFAAHYSLASCLKMVFSETNRLSLNNFDFEVPVERSHGSCWTSNCVLHRSCKVEKRQQ